MPSRPTLPQKAYAQYHLEQEVDNRMTSQQAAVHMDNEARAQNIHKTQLSPTDKQVKLLRRSGFSDRIIEGINNEEAKGMISLMDKGHSVDEVTNLRRHAADDGQRNRVKELGYRRSTPANYVEAEGIIHRLERNRMLGPRRVAYLVKKHRRRQLQSASE